MSNQSLMIILIMIDMMSDEFRFCYYFVRIIYTLGEACPCDLYLCAVLWVVFS